MVRDRLRRGGSVVSVGWMVVLDFDTLVCDAGLTLCLACGIWCIWLWR